MTHWNYQKFKRVLDEFLDDEDPSDPKVRKRRRILEAATKLFIRHGYRKTSIEDVAKNASMAKGTVYLYFKTKADLLMHAIAEEKRRYMLQFRPFLDPGMAPGERLRRWIKTALVLGTEMPLISKLTSGDREILSALEEVDTDQSQEWEGMRHEFIGDIVEQAAGPHTWTSMELRDRTAVLLGLFYFSGMLADERIRGGLSVERFAEILADMISDGICASNRSGDPSKE